MIMLIPNNKPQEYKEHAVFKSDLPLEEVLLLFIVYQT